MKLKMKSYIKPFEKVLGILELEKMTGMDSLEIADDDMYDLDSNVDEEILLKNLAYWEYVGENPEHITQQAVLESTYDGTEQYARLNLFAGNEVPLKKTRILRYGVHDIHEYKGKFFPQLVRACINISGVAPGSVVLDPFCGSGTALCEAKVRGMKAVGIDLNPLSVMISRVKTDILDIKPREIENAYKKLISVIDTGNAKPSKRWNEADSKYLAGWFAKEALDDISVILTAVESVDNTIIADFFRVNLSNIIREISWQKESDLRVRKEVGTYQAGFAVQRFKEEADRQFKRIFSYLKYVNNLCMLEGEVVEGNTLVLTDRLQKLKGKCDVIITSPPYATALPYLDTDRLSIIVLGLMHRNEFPEKNENMVGNREVSEKHRQELWTLYQNRRGELTPQICSIIDAIAEVNHKPGIGFRRRNLPALLAKYFLDMLDSMTAADKMLKPGAMAFYVVGNNSTELNGEKFMIETNLLLWDLAAKIGWHKEEYIDMDMVKASMGFRNNPGTTEAILVFRKRG